LNVRNFEALKIEEVGGGNTAPVANPDLGVFVSEDAIDVSIDALANDTDADGDELTLVTAEVTGGLGTATIVGNQVVYNPGDSYQFLAAGATANVKIAYSISDGDATAASTVDIVVTGVNDAPVAQNDSIGTTANVDGRISVAVVAASTHVDAATQLDDRIFDAVQIDLADAKVWTADSLNAKGYEVVVLGGSGGTFDYVTGVELFGALNSFVANGGGVVTTGFFAFQLRNMSDEIQSLADNITPIESVWNNETGGPNAQITVNDSNHPIVRNLDWFEDSNVYLSNASIHEFAPKIDGGLTPLATAQFGVPAVTVTAIAYAEKVGLDTDEMLPGGQTVYLGAPYVAEPVYASGTDTGVSDQIFEQAVAWAAGARSVNVTIDKLQLLDNFEDVDSPDASLVIDSVSLMEANGATIRFDDNGDIVYSLQGQALEQFLEDGSITANFDYTVTDGLDTSAAASVSLLVNQVDIL